MYNIQLSASPQFNVNVASKPPQTGWLFDPPTELTIINFIGQGNPSSVVVDTTIKDYILALGNGTYDNFYVKLTVNHPIINGNTAQWLTVTGDIAAATGDGYELTQANLNVDTNLAFNVTNIPRGFTETRLDFKVYGKRPGGQMVLLETINYRVYLRRLNVGEIYLQPSGILEFSYVIGSGLPAGKTKSLFCIGAFTASVGDHIALSGSGTFSLVSDIDGVKTYSGSGSQTITFTLESSIDTEDDTNPWYATEAAFTTSSGGAYGVPIRVYVYENNVRTVVPSYLEFFAIKGVREAQSQRFYINGLGAWTITRPNWLLQAGSNSGNDTDTRLVYPIHSDNLNPGVYTGIITVVFGGETFEILLKHTVVDGLSTGFSGSIVNFTKDREGISQIYGLDNQKVNIHLDIESFDYFTLFSSFFSGDFSKGIFNVNTDFWLGELVHKAMPSLRKLSSIALESFKVPPGAGGFFTYKVFRYFNPSQTHFWLKYFNRFSGVQEGDDRDYYGIQFLKGRRPKRFSPTFGIIDYKESPIRVTKNSYTLLPVFRNNSISLIEIYRNGVRYKKIYPDRGDIQLFGVQLCFGPFTQGDVIEARVLGSLDTPGEIPFYSQTYIMFPEGKLSYHIVWENEHGLPEVLEFTGDYSFPSEHKGISSLTFDNYLESLEKMGSQRTLKFSANTGWILKANQERIDSLVDANRAWIVFTDDRKPIDLVPDDAKITNIDSEAETYQYTVAFTINPQHELENNSF